MFPNIFAFAALLLIASRPDNKVVAVSAAPSAVPTAVPTYCDSPCPTSCEQGHYPGTAWTDDDTGCTVYCLNQPVNGQCLAGGSGCQSSCLEDCDSPCPTSCEYGFVEGAVWGNDDTGCIVFCLEEPSDGQCLAGGSGCESSCLAAPNPTAEPSTEPSQEPTVHPTGPSYAPTYAPTTSDLVEFEAEQIIDGISIDEYNSDNVTYPLTLKETIASLMDGVTSDDIVDLEVAENMDSSEESSESRRLRSVDNEVDADAEGRRRLQNSTVSNSISAEYVVKVHNSSLTYSTTSGQLKDGVADGTFDRNINVFAVNNGALAFVNATSTSVSTENLINDGGDGDSKKKDDDDDSDDGLSDGAIAGIVIGVLVGVAIIGGIAYYFVNKSKSSEEALDQSLMSGSTNMDRY